MFMMDLGADEHVTIPELASPIVSSTSHLLLYLHPIASSLSYSRPTPVMPRWDTTFSMRVRGWIPKAFGSRLREMVSRVGDQLPWRTRKGNEKEPRRLYVRA